MLSITKRYSKQALARVLVFSVALLYLVSQAVDVYLFHFIFDIHLPVVAMLLMFLTLVILCWRSIPRYLPDYKYLLGIFVLWSIYLIVNSIYGANVRSSAVLLFRFVGSWLIAFQLGIYLYRGEKEEWKVISLALAASFTLITLIWYLQSIDPAFFRWLMPDLRNHSKIVGWSGLYVNPNILGFVLVLNAALVIWYTLGHRLSVFIIPCVWLTALFGVLESRSASAFMGTIALGIFSLWAFYECHRQSLARYSKRLKIGVAMGVFVGAVAISTGLAFQLNLSQVLDPFAKAILQNDPAYRTYGWSTFDYDPSPGQIEVIYDDQRHSQVLELSSVSLPGRFIYRFDSSETVNNEGANVIKWRMRFSRPFVVSVSIQTDKGPEELLYTPGKLYVESVYEVGMAFDLGPNLTDGKWHTIARNLSDDLKKWNPDAKVIEVKAFSIQGNGRIDNLTLGQHFRETFESNDEVQRSGRTHGWSTPEDHPAAVKITRAYDDQLRSYVVDLSTVKLPNHYVLSLEGTKPAETSQATAAKWSMNFSQPVVITILVHTDRGLDELLYTSPKLYADTVYEAGLAFDLGSNLTDGKWHTVTRNLQADLQHGRPGAKLFGVKGLKIQGDGKIDDIRIGNYLNETFEGESLLKRLERLPGQIDKTRVDIWKRAFGYWKESPWLGIGLGSFQHMPTEKNFYHCHNFLLTVLVEQGLIGFTFLSIFVVMLLWQMRSWLGTMLLASLLYTQLFDDMSLVFSFPVYASFVLGYCFCLVLRKQHEAR